jgi:hypothetical protein
MIFRSLLTLGDSRILGNLPRAAEQNWSTVEKGRALDEHHSPGWVWAAFALPLITSGFSFLKVVQFFTSQ